MYIFVVIKTDLSQQQPLKWLKCISLYKNNEATLLKKTIEPSQKILTPSEMNHRSQMPLQTINF